MKAYEQRCLAENYLQELKNRFIFLSFNNKNVNILREHHFNGLSVIK